MTIKKPTIEVEVTNSSLLGSKTDRRSDTTPRSISPQNDSPVKMEGNHGENSPNTKQSSDDPPPVLTAKQKNPPNPGGKGGFKKGGRVNKKKDITALNSVMTTGGEIAITESDQHDPAATLKKLGFDPIVAVVKTIKEVDVKLRWMKRQAKPSMPSIAQLMNTKRALVADLLRYGYRPVPEKTINEQVHVPIGITLTDKPMTDIGIERVTSSTEQVSIVEETKH